MAGFQSFLAIGAMALLAMVSLRFNTNVLQNSSTEIENKVYLTAFSLADDLIEEMKQKAFDEKTIDFQAINATQLTPTGALDKESGESWPNFDDIDDYNNYSRPISLPHAEGYQVTCYVNYVDANGNKSLNPTYFKKVLVKVNSKYLSHDLTLSFIFSLHSKN